MKEPGVTSSRGPKAGRLGTGLGFAIPLGGRPRGARPENRPCPLGSRRARQGDVGPSGRAHASPSPLRPLGGGAIVAGTAAAAGVFRVVPTRPVTSAPWTDDRRVSRKPIASVQINGQGGYPPLNADGKRSRAMPAQPVDTPSTPRREAGGTRPQQHAGGYPFDTARRRDATPRNARPSSSNGISNIRRRAPDGPGSGDRRARPAIRGGNPRRDPSNGRLTEAAGPFSGNRNRPTRVPCLPSTVSAHRSMQATGRSRRDGPIRSGKYRLANGRGLRHGTRRGPSRATLVPRAHSRRSMADVSGSGRSRGSAKAARPTSVALGRDGKSPGSRQIARTAAAGP